MMKKSIWVNCLDEDKKMLFVAKTPYKAMQNVIYYLNLSHRDLNSKVELLGGGRTLAFEHNGKTYATLNN